MLEILKFQVYFRFWKGTSGFKTKMLEILKFQVYFRFWKDTSGFKTKMLEILKFQVYFLFRKDTSGSKYFKFHFIHGNIVKFMYEISKSFISVWIPVWKNYFRFQISKSEDAVLSKHDFKKSAELSREIFSQR